MRATPVRARVRGRTPARRPVPPAVSAALSIVSQTFSDGTLRLDHVARRVNLSRSHLSRLVREATGRSLREHVVHCRMRAAQRYLAETHLRVKEIAAATGYSSTSAFDHEFIRRIGTSPRIWRLRHAGRGSAAQPVNR